MLTTGLPRSPSRALDLRFSTWMRMRRRNRSSDHHVAPAHSPSPGPGPVSSSSIRAAHLADGREALRGACALFPRRGRPPTEKWEKTGPVEKVGKSGLGRFLISARAYFFLLIFLDRQFRWPFFGPLSHFPFGLAVSNISFKSRGENRTQDRWI